MVFVWVVIAVYVQLSAGVFQQAELAEYSDAVAEDRESSVSVC